jgi:hypothetical protein
MPRSPQPLKHVLAADATLAAWEARRRQEATLTGLLSRHLPRSLAQRVRVVDATGPELIVAADAGAIAAAVKQRLPDLLAALRQEALQFSSIRVRVQVRIDPPQRLKRDFNHIDRSTLQTMTKLARDLPDGPLKVALAKFVRRAG